MYEYFYRLATLRQVPYFFLFLVLVEGNCVVFHLSLQAI